MTISNKMVMERYGKLKEHDRSFDIQFWQLQSPQARMNAAWEMIVHAYRVKGIDVRQLRLDKSVEVFQRQEKWINPRNAAENQTQSILSARRNAASKDANHVELG